VIEKRELVSLLRGATNLQAADCVGDALFLRAANTRSRAYGDAIYLRALIELSNFCRRRCAYCGIGAFNRDLGRYRIQEAALLAASKEAAACGYRTVVLQAGEDPELVGKAGSRLVASWIRRIKETGIARVTLSLGAPDGDALSRWRDAGADRYLMRFETSNPALYGALHPGDSLRARLRDIERLQTLGYEVGSGMLVGLPGQRIEDVANDVLLCRDLDLDMIGIGPYLPHPAAPLSSKSVPKEVSGSELIYRVIAATRLLCPRANIPATTALETRDRTAASSSGDRARPSVDAAGQLRALRCGANVIMINFSPQSVRRLYALYPNKATDLAGSEATIALENRTAAAGYRAAVDHVGDALRPQVDAR
jgi:biotin synthase